MNILLPPGLALFWLCSGLAAVLLILAAWRAPWRQLAAAQDRQHLFLAAILALAILWLFNVSIKNAIAFHPILMTVTAMVLGWSLALLAGAIALLVLEVFQLALHRAVMDWDIAWSQFTLTTLPVDFCLNVAVPVCWTWCVIELVNRWKFKNPFTFFMGVGFFGAMLSCVLIDVFALALFRFTDSFAHLAVVEEHFWLFLLMAFPEGFINGTLATAFTVFWPDIVKTYRDDWYLKD